MAFVIGRENGDGIESAQQHVADDHERPVGTLGRYRALDGSDGAPLEIDLDGPHAMLVVGKRGYGKSYTLGVLAEELARAGGVAPVVVDPVGVFSELTHSADGQPVPASVIEDPSVVPTSIDPRSWCSLLGLSPESGAGGLIWQAAGRESTLQAMCEHVDSTDAARSDTRAALNHLKLAASWDVFDADGLTAEDLAGPEVTVIDLSQRDDSSMNAVVRGIGEALYRARVTDAIDRLPWLVLDEAHTFFDGIAGSILETILTRGRAPGVSLVLATQRPSAVPEVGVSQSDVMISHRLTSQADIEALEYARPTFLQTSLHDRMPTAPGEAVIIDDSTETVHLAQIRPRETPHGGNSPSAGDFVH